MESDYVLFIDDNFEPLRPVLDSVAKTKGLNVLYASSVADGFGILDKNSDNINAVLLDLLFAGQTTQGEEALKELRDRYPHIPVVVLTDSYDNTAAAIQCIKNGAYDFMGKRSLDTTHLFHVLGNAINETHLKNRIRQKLKIVAASNPPAVQFQHNNQVCRFAYKLNSISMQTDPELLNQLISASVRWHYNLLHVIVSSYRDNLQPSLILVKQGQRSEIDIYLVFSLSESNEENLKSLAAEFITSIEPYILSRYDSNPRPYLLEPVVDSEILNKILSPKINNPSIRLYNEPVCWGDPDDFNLEMNDGEQYLDAEFLPKIQSGEWYSNYNLLAQSMLSSTGTSYLCAHLQPLRLRFNENDFLRKVTDEKISIPSELPAEMADDYKTYYKNIVSSFSDYYLFEIRYLSDIHNSIPRPLDVEINRYFYPQGSVVKSTLQTGLFDNLFSIDKKRPLARLSFIKGRKEVSWLFRLPEPAAKSMKGFPYQNSSMQIIPGNLSDTGLLLGEKLINGETKSIRIETDSLKKHMYVLGQTGTGKTTLLKSMILDAISANHGFCVIDPHGDLIEDVEKMIPDSRKQDVVWFDTNNLKGSAKLNMLVPEVAVQQTMLLDELVRILAFEYDYKNVGGPIFETYFKSTINLVMRPEVINKFGTPTLQMAYNALLVPDFLRQLLSLVKSDDVPKSPFQEELENIFKTALSCTGDYDWNNVRPYIYSKFKFFVDNDYIRELFDNKEPTLNFRNIMDNGKILLVRMEKGYIGPANLGKIGMLFLNKLISSILSRTELPAPKRKDFFVFIDEFQNFMKGDVGSALSEVRKYNVGLVLANQTIGQLDDFLLQSVMGNVGSTAFFRTGINDVGKIRHFIEPDFNTKELINLQNFNCVARIMNNNKPSDPFIFQTIKP